jgi:DNA-binding NarL/FixJ family response regulator
MYSIIVVDDHKLFREGFKVLLDNLSYIEEVTEADSGAAFLSLITLKQPDIVFMDIEMPGMNGITATKEALKRFPDIKIIALSMYGDEHYYSQMITAGARGFMLKNSGMQDVENAIDTLINGNNYFSPEILNRLIKGLGRHKTEMRSDTLSERETEVLFHICKGLSNQEIAKLLFLSKRTVDKHRENLLSKTNAKNTAGLVMYAVKNNIVDV